MNNFKPKKIQDILFPYHYFRSNVHTISPVPTYFFHRAEAREFTQICNQIITHNFCTITFGELLKGSEDVKQRILLTFDDGWSTTWSIAFPLARRYGIRFTLFIIPKAIEDSEEVRSNLDNGDNPASLIDRDRGSRCMLTWGEVKAMHDSGLVEIQSHSLTHGVIFSSDTLEEFQWIDGPLPLYAMAPLISHVNGRDVSELHPPFGTPIYTLGHALGSPRRFIEHQKVREKCIALVKKSGGANFFYKEGWRNQLKEIVEKTELGRWEDRDERRKRFRNDLSQAKKMIEKRLPGAKVRVLAPPWGVMHPDLPDIAKETGHELIVLCYPMPSLNKRSSLPLYPRLKGDAIWPMLNGPIRGAMGWWKARRRILHIKESDHIPL